MALIHVNESDFREKVLENTGTVLVDFWANWCGPCRMLGPELEQLAADRPDVTVAKVDVDENMSLAAAYGVPSRRISNDAQVAEAIDAMLTSQGPYRLICDVDPMATT